MYQNIDFSKTGGFPLTQDVMAFLQDAYNQVFSSLTGIIGSYGIITGVNLSGGTYTDGWVTYDGEIVPFVGAPVSQGPNVSIEEIVTSVTYRDSGLQGVIKTRRAILGASGQPITSFTRVTLADTTTALTNSNTALTNANTALSNSNSALSTANTALVAANSALPSGAIILWSGSIASIPSGYVLCNGSSGTPDLRDRFVVGAGSTYSVGNTGGLNSVTLTVAQLPSHQHDVNIRTNSQDYVDGGSSPNNIGTAFSGTMIKTSNIGGNSSHENRPPYYALCYIMKT